MVRIIDLSRIENKDMGYLSYFEMGKEIDFCIKRIYYIYGVNENVKRGMHAHKALKQIIWCPYGAIEMVFDDGKNTSHVLLDEPTKAIVVEKPLWRDMYWKKTDSVLCVGASEVYDEMDYIRDYDLFIKYIEECESSDEN